MDGVLRTCNGLEKGRLFGRRTTGRGFWLTVRTQVRSSVKKLCDGCKVRFQSCWVYMYGFGAELVDLPERPAERWEVRLHYL